MPPQRSEDSASLGVNFLKLIYRFNAIPVNPQLDNGETDIENRLTDTGRGEERVRLWKE